MTRRNFNELQYFVTLAREGSFTRAAALLGVTQSAISQTIRGLEQRLQLRLLTLTTRSVAPTAAGERLMHSLGRHFDDIESELSALTAMRDKPAGSIRITSSELVLHSVLLPKLSPVLREYPDIHIEFDVSYEFRDIVADRFDAGVRMGESIAQDMVAIPIGPQLRMAVVATPDYFSAHTIPQRPQDLLSHPCINLRLANHGGLYRWEFARQSQPLNVHVQGQLVFNTSPAIVHAALAGLGVALLPEDEVLPQIEAGRLRRVLDDWCPAFPGYHLYYPHRRQPSAAFGLVLEALRYRAAPTQTTEPRS